MFKKELPIIFIGLCAVIAVLVLGWAVFVKTEVPIQVPVVNDKPIENGDSVLDSDIFDDLKGNQVFSVSKSEFKVLNKFNALELESKSKDCGTNKSEQYFKEFLSHYSKNDKGVEYQFKYQGQTQDSGVWIVTAIPNKIGYVNLGDFKNDFNLCEAGSNMYPYLVSEKYLLFVSSCGTGYDNGSGLPYGCDVVRKIIEPTIKINNNISEIDTSDWKTYRSEEYGFEMKYPEDDLDLSDYKSDKLYQPYNDKLIVEVNKLLCCDFSFDDGMSMEVSYSADKSKYPNLDDLFKIERKGMSKETFSVEKYSYKNFEGIKIISIDSKIEKEERVDLFLKTDDGFYFFSWYVSDPEDRGFTYTDYFVPMLSTFKFTEK